jgi:hypothetical protein
MATLVAPAAPAGADVKSPALAVEPPFGLSDATVGIWPGNRLGSAEAASLLLLHATSEAAKHPTQNTPSMFDMTGTLSTKRSSQCGCES